MNTLKFIFIIFLILPGFVQNAPGQNEEKDSITLEGIFKNYTFYQRSVRGINWMNDGQYYTSRVRDNENYTEHILKYDITTGKPVDTLVNGKDLVPEGGQYNLAFSDYSFSPDEEKVLFATEREPIYRYSSKAYYYLYDLSSKKLIELTSGTKQSNATFSPDGTKVAFTRNNNLFYVTLEDMELHQVTTTGEKNKIIHGSSDWVYEEEFYMTKAFFWSPKGDKLAYYTFDESEVPMYNMQMWKGLYPEMYTFKYPKAGEKNSKVSITTYHLPSQKTVKMDIEVEEDYYIPRIQWTRDNNQLAITRMNRLQNKMEILMGDASKGATREILTEKSETFVDINYYSDLIFLENQKTFLRTSEKDGYKHIYQHHIKGKEKKQITQGNWEVSELLGINENNNRLYFLSTEDSPLERQLYSIQLDGTGKTRLTPEEGTHEINMSPDFKYFINYHSMANTPQEIILHKTSSAMEIKVLEDNKQLKQKIKNYQFGTKEFFSFTTDYDVNLNGWMIKPHDFDPSKKYPVLMYAYGGPGDQKVMKEWGGHREAWFHYLAQKGYIIACVDNRGTGGRGKDFKHLVYGQLGKLEVQDQISAAKYLGSLPYIYQDRIGIWGWSYGGYLSALGIFIGADVFNMAISVAPVTNWRFYDTIYTERYLKTPSLNPEGYDNYSPINHAGKLEDPYLLIHGTGDDNVHLQNSMELQNALIKEGKQYDVFYYPNRNHGIYGGNATFHLYQKMTNFITENL